MKTQFEEQLVCYSKQRMYLFTKAGDSIFMTTVLGARFSFTLQLGRGDDMQGEI